MEQQHIEAVLFASVKFVSEVISVKKDKDDKIIEGNPNKIKLVTDNWKFTKNILKKGPNWYLSEIVSKWLKKKYFSRRYSYLGKLYKKSNWYYW